MKPLFLFFCVTFVTLVTYAQDSILAHKGTPGQVEANLVQALPMGNSTVIVLNKGVGDNVHKGDQGYIVGFNDVPFTITETYAARSKATVAILSEKIGQQKKAIIILQKGKPSR